jgi:hypothetical protein
MQFIWCWDNWRWGEGVFGDETPAPMPQTPKELGELIGAAAMNCDRVQLLAKALTEIWENGQGYDDAGNEVLSEDAKVAKDALKEAGMEG